VCRAGRRTHRTRGARRVRRVNSTQNLVDRLAQLRQRGLVDLQLFERAQPASEPQGGTNLLAVNEVARWRPGRRRERAAKSPPIVSLTVRSRPYSSRPEGRRLGRCCPPLRRARPRGWGRANSERKMRLFRVSNTSQRLQVRREPAGTFRDGANWAIPLNECGILATPPAFSRVDSAALSGRMREATSL
jgi:hypothetical protein